MHWKGKEYKGRVMQYGWNDLMGSSYIVVRASGRWTDRSWVKPIIRVALVSTATICFLCIAFFFLFYKASVKPLHILVTPRQHEIEVQRSQQAAAYLSVEKNVSTSTDYFCSFCRASMRVLGMKTQGYSYDLQM